MSSVLNRELFLVKEHVGMFKASNQFDIFDPDSGEKIMECREPNIGFVTKLFRFTDYKTMTPFDVQVTDTAGNLVTQVKRGVAFFRSNIEVLDGDGT